MSGGKNIYSSFLFNIKENLLLDINVFSLKFKLYIYF